MANRPPSSWTIGRSSGGMTGTASRTIISGLLPECRKAREDLQALDRAGLLLALAGPDLLLEVLALVLEHDARHVLRGAGRRPACGRRRRRAAGASRSYSAFSRSSSRMCSAPMPPPKYSPKPNGEPKRCLSSRKNVSSAMIVLGRNSSFSIGLSA